MPDDCRAACEPKENLLPAPSLGLFGNRHRETRIELHARSWQQFVHGISAITKQNHYEKHRSSFGIINRQRLRRIGGRSSGHSV